jgi:hypothetical protein
MTMPNKTQIVEKATELWRTDRVRANDPSFNLTPEASELREGGYLCAAQSELMRDESKAESAEWKNYNENLESSSDFEVDLEEAMRTTCFIAGSRGVGKSDVVMRIAERMQNEGIIVIVFDPSMDWLKRSNIEKYITVTPYSDLPIPETSTIFDVSRLTPNEMQQCVEEFCKKLFEFQVGNSAKRFYLVLEEAQIYFPLNSLRSLKTQNSMRLLTVGRNFNVSMCAVSQFPALIDKEMIKHSGQIWIGYASEPNSLKYWRGIIGKRAEKLRELQNGQFVYYCRNKITTIEIEPYESAIQKTQIATLDIAIHPISAMSHSDASEIMRILMFLGLFVVIVSIIGNLR